MSLLLFRLFEDACDPRGEIFVLNSIMGELIAVKYYVENLKEPVLYIYSVLHLRTATLELWGFQLEISKTLKSKYLNNFGSRNRKPAFCFHTSFKPLYVVKKYRIL